jgi:hypothetical protein
LLLLRVDWQHADGREGGSARTTDEREGGGARTPDGHKGGGVMNRGPAMGDRRKRKKMRVIWSKIFEKHIQRVSNGIFQIKREL